MKNQTFSSEEHYPIESIKLSEYVIVIPSIRNINQEYIKHIPSKLKILVVDDSNGNITPNRENMEVFDYEKQRKIMGTNYDLIPHKTAACRNFGFYYIWKHTDYKYILTVDDDCDLPEDFLYQYSKLGSTFKMSTISIEGWFNTIDYLNVGEKLFARGYPYWERYEKKIKHEESYGKLVCLMGLWTKYLDFDGLDKYLFEKYRRKYNSVHPNCDFTRIGSPKKATKFPFCGMNFGFIRDVLPIMYQMPMAETFTADYSLWRFDDIWAGYIIQSLIHKKGDAIGIGKPLVVHKKAGNLSKEVCGEHYGHLISSFFYQLIEKGLTNVKPSETYSRLYVELFEYLNSNFEKMKKQYKIPTLYCPYLKQTFRNLLRWGKIFCE